MSNRVYGGDGTIKQAARQAYRMMTEHRESSRREERERAADHPQGENMRMTKEFVHTKGKMFEK